MIQCRVSGWGLARIWDFDLAANSLLNARIKRIKSRTKKLQVSIIHLIFDLIFHSSNVMRHSALFSTNVQQYSYHFQFFFDFFLKYFSFSVLNFSRQDNFLFIYSFSDLYMTSNLDTRQIQYISSGNGTIVSFICILTLISFNNEPNSINWVLLVS